MYPISTNLSGNFFDGVTLQVEATFFRFKIYKAWVATDPSVDTA